MTEAKYLGGVRFKSHPRAGRVLGIYLLGGFILNLVLTGVMILAGLMLAVFLGAGDMIDIEQTENIEQMLTSASPVFVLIYFAMFLVIGAASQALFTLPLARHFSEVTQILDPGEINMIQQRDRDEFGEAEGFADALDVGAAI